MRAPGAMLAFAAMLAACSSGNPGPFISIPVASNTFITSTATNVSLPLLTLSGSTVTGSAPVADAAVTVTETLSATLPGGVTPLGARRDVVPTNADLLFVQFTPQQPVTLSASLAMTFAGTGIVPGTAYSLGEYVNGVWTAPFAGPVTASATSVAFASVNMPVTMTPNAPVTFALYSGTAVTPAPSASPNVLVFDAAAPSSQAFAVSEAYYANAFDATMTCVENPPGQTPPANAFVAQFAGGATTATAMPASAGSSVTLTVDSGAQTGSCEVSVKDSKGNAANLTVDVSSSSVVIDRASRP